MIEICALASGSNGNCYYIGNETEAVLIDAGISCKQIISRMNEKKLKPSNVKAVFISHEHSDHIRGARVFAKKMYVPVYLTAKTYLAAYHNMQPAFPRFFEPGKEIKAGEFIIYPFLKNHDASEPCSFRISCGDKNIGVLTDIGEPCSNVTAHLPLCDAVFLESNYDEDMLRTGSYPYYLKQRVASPFGHLSNLQAFRLLNENTDSRLKVVFLSHLSAENNTPELALNACSGLVSKFEIRLTSRYAPADIYRLE
jgi:phosphoribosyl 1,2-cyclic phosphodiesterase